jgi:apolipoprotein N-acyltransferase
VSEPGAAGEAPGGVAGEPTRELAREPTQGRIAAWLASRWPGALASLGAGALATLAFAPFHAFWLAPVLLAAALVLVQTAANARAAALRGLLFGLGWFLGGVSWVYVSLNVYGAMPLPLAALATLGFCAYLALFPALAFGLLKYVPVGPRWLAAFPACWVLSEWLRGWLFTGFTWQAVGYSQTTESPLAGLAPIGGVYLIALAVTFTAAALWWWLRAVFAPLPAAPRASLTRRAAPLLAAALLWIAGALLARVEWTAPAGEPIEVALLQGNVAQDMKWREDRVITTFDTYWRLIEASGDAQLIVLPETALPVFSDQLPNDYLAQLVDRARARRADILIGIVERSDNRRQYFNSVFSVGSAPVQVYRKQHLVPFGEFVPPLFGWVIQWLQIPLQDFSRGGADQVPMLLSGQRVAINICYEDTFGEEIIGQLPAATILVNVSNTAWFGRSLAQPQHLQIARMRALETGRPMLRATNTGMTAAIDARGQVLALADPFTETALRVRVQGREGATPFVRVGNALAVGIALALALLLAAIAATGQRRS